MATRTVYVEAPLAQVHIDAVNRDIRVWLAEEIASDASRYAAVDTGYMSTHIEPNADHTRVIAAGAGIPPNREAPAFVEYGTRAHEIQNAFGWGITVHHPGTTAQPFLRPAAYTRRVVPPWVVRARASESIR